MKQRAYMGEMYVAEPYSCSVHDIFGGCSRFATFGWGKKWVCELLRGLVEDRGLVWFALAGRGYVGNGMPGRCLRLAYLLPVQSPLYHDTIDLITMILSK